MKKVAVSTLAALVVSAWIFGCFVLAGVEPFAETVGTQLMSFMLGLLGPLVFIGVFAYQRARESEDKPQGLM